MNASKFTVGFLFAVVASLASAGETHVYSQGEFDKLTADNKPVLLEVSAPWCPTCKAQKPILSDLMSQPAYKDVTMLTIDFDTSKPLLGKLKVGMQSTLVAFKGKEEVGRSVGDTTREGIDALVKKTVN